MVRAILAFVWGQGAALRTNRTLAVLQNVRARVRVRACVRACVRVWRARACAPECAVCFGTAAPLAVVRVGRACAALHPGNTPCRCILAPPSGLPLSLPRSFASVISLAALVLSRAIRYIYVFTRVCVCVCVRGRARARVCVYLQCSSPPLTLPSAAGPARRVGRGGALPAAADGVWHRAGERHRLLGRAAGPGLGPVGLAPPRGSSPGPALSRKFCGLNCEGLSCWGEVWRCSGETRCSTDSWSLVLGLATGGGGLKLARDLKF